MKESDLKSLSKDLNYGLVKQKNIFIIENFNKNFNCKLNELKYKFARMDYIDEEKKIYVELKSRRCSSYMFDTTLIPKDKIDYAKKRIIEGYKCYLLFVFENYEHYYIEIDDDKFKRYECKKFKRGFRIDTNDKEKDYYYIPISDLIDITPCFF